MLKIYRASAGSGKTFSLTREYLLLLYKNNTVNQHRRILAVTFTNKATEEMKSRILKELFLLANSMKSDHRIEIIEATGLTADAVDKKAALILTNLLHDYSSFSVSTIDKFFQQVIRAFARDIGVHGGYQLELDTELILDQAVDHLFMELSAAENKQLLDWMTQFAEERIEESENWNLRTIIRNLGKEIFKENYQHKAEITNKKLHDREFLNNYRNSIRKVMNDFEENAKRIAQEGISIIEKHGLEFKDFKGGSTSQINKFNHVIEGKYELTATFRKMAENEDECYKIGDDEALKERIRGAYNAGLQTAMKNLCTLIDEDILLYNTGKIILKHLSTLGILSDLAMQIRKLTADQNIMMISDTNSMLNKIIDHSDAPFIYEKTGIRIDHYMIDEFQDTSTLQWRNFQPLLANSLANGNMNLVVGDVKQSIYRWRNSDWRLLDHQINEDFKNENRKETPLKTNYRSDKNVINFNNAIFSTMAQSLQNLLNADIEPVIQIIPELKDITKKITNAYKDTKQIISNKAGEGQIRIQFLEAESDEDEKFKVRSLQQLPSLLEEFQEKGFQPSDIAVLVRKNQEEQMVIQHLLKHKKSPQAKENISYDIMGTEGLMLGSSSSVRFLLGVMKLLLDPGDKIQQTIVNFEYARGRHKLSLQDALRDSMNAKITDNCISSLFSSDENDQLKKLQQLSLFEMTERIIALFEITQWHGEAVFIQSLQDLIFRFSTGKSSDLFSFLHWWEKFGDKQFIATPQNNKAVRIMTVHKSKGLDFKVVIMPFCDWTLDNRLKPILWCNPKKEPFNHLPLLPVEYSSALGKTIFAEEYFREKMHTYVDNINVAYVAFTRTRHAMVCLCPKPKTNNDGIIKINSLASLLYTTLSNKDHDFFSKHFDQETDQFILGSTVGISSKSNEDEAPNTESNLKRSTTQLNNYPVAVAEGRMHVKHGIQRFSDEPSDITSSPIEYGTLMHELLDDLQREEDIPILVERFIREGRITTEEAAIVTNDVWDFWKIPGVQEWFREDLQVMSESTILTPGGQYYRPDRIVIDGNKATVIDYKFGAHEKISYHRQVQQYTKLLQEMGYETSGYLCYVQLKKIVTVSD